MTIKLYLFKNGRNNTLKMKNITDRKERTRSMDASSSRTNTQRYAFSCGNWRCNLKKKENYQLIQKKSFWSEKTKKTFKSCNFLSLSFILSPHGYLFCLYMKKKKETPQHNFFTHWCSDESSQKNKFSAKKKQK